MNPRSLKNELALLAIVARRWSHLAALLINHLGLPVAHYIGGDTIPNSTFSQHALSNAKSDAVADLRNDRIIHFDLFFILYLLFMLQTASFFI